MGVARRAVWTLICVCVLAALNLSARTRFWGYVTQGGQRHQNVGIYAITRAGATQTNPYTQQSYPNATVTVCQLGLDCVADPTKRATIYSDVAGTTLTNPFAATNTGLFTFYGDFTSCDLRFSGGGITIPFTWPGFTVGGGGGGTSGNDISQMATGGTGVCGVSPWTGWEDTLIALPVNSYITAAVGCYSQTKLITVKRGWIIQGGGKDFTGGTIFKSSFSGTAFRTAFPLPGLAQASVSVRDISIQNTNGANTGSGFLETGGAYVELTNVSVQGFRYGHTFVGTEVWRDVGFNLQFQLRAGIWIVDGSDYQPPYADIDLSANPNFTTNVGVFIDGQINEGGSTVGLVDDGGGPHTFVSVNWNGCSKWIRATACDHLSVEASRFEGLTDLNPIDFELGTFNSGLSLGPSSTFSMKNCLVLADQLANAHCITVGGSALTALRLDNNTLNSTVDAVHGTVNINTLVNELSKNTAGGGTLYDATPFHLIDMAAALTLANAPLVMAPTFGIQRSGESTLAGGAAIVTCSTCTANTLVIYSRKTIGGAVGNMSYTVAPGASFTFSSTSGTDTSTIVWTLVEKQ